jgi:hypothetical protein
MSGIQPGDYVRVGDSDLTWFVRAIYPEDSSAFGPLAHLSSGLTERSRYEPVANLTLFKRAEVFDA